MDPATHEPQQPRQSTPASSRPDQRCSAHALEISIMEENKFTVRSCLELGAEWLGGLSLRQLCCGARENLLDNSPGETASTPPS